MKTSLGIALLLAVSLAAAPASAQESRQFNRIPSPKAAEPLPPGARAVVSVRPVSRAKVQAAVDRLAAAWNTPALRALLSPAFYDKDRLLDALQVQVPRDARLRVLSVQGVQTLAQYIQSTHDGDILVSRVSATVRTQVEYNDPRAGFQRLDGTNELGLLMREPMP